MLQGARRIGFREFMAALPLMAEDRGISVEEVRRSPPLSCLKPKISTPVRTVPHPGPPLLAEGRGITVEEVRSCPRFPLSTMAPGQSQPHFLLSAPGPGRGLRGACLF